MRASSEQRPGWLSTMPRVGRGPLLAGTLPFLRRLVVAVGVCEWLHAFAQRREEAFRCLAMCPTSAVISAINCSVSAVVGAMAR